MPEEEPKKYISLQEATKYCPYSQEYLSLRARQGKLKAIKIGRNWATTKEWVEEYLKKIEEYNNDFRASKTAAPPENLPVTEKPFSEIVTPRVDKTAVASKIRFGVALALIFLLIIAGGVLGKESFQNVFRQANPYLKAFNQEIDKGISKSWQDIQLEAQRIGQAAGQGISGGWTEINKEVRSVRDLVTNGPKEISRDISKGLQEISQAGDSLLRGITAIAKSFGESLASISKGIGGMGRGIAKGAEAVFQTSGDFGLAIWQGINKSLAGLVEGVKGIGQGVTDIGSGLGQRASEFWQFVTQPFKKEIVVEEKEEAPIIPEELRKEISQLGQEVEKLKTEGLPAKEIVKEVEKEVTEITKIEPVKEITKETIKIDDRALAEIRASLSDLEQKTTSLETRATQAIYYPTVPYIAPATPTRDVKSGDITLLAANNLDFTGNPINLRGDTNVVGSLAVGTTTTLTIDTAGNLTTAGTITTTGEITEGGNVLSAKYIAIPSRSAQGDILYYDGSTWTRLAAGTSGQFLQTQGTGANPVWASAAGGVWTDGGTITYLTSTSDDVAIGGTDANSPFFLDVSVVSFAFNSTTPSLIISDTGTFSITDGTNTLLSLADSGTSGTLTVDTISPTTMNTFTLAGDITGSGLPDITAIGTVSASNLAATNTSTLGTVSSGTWQGSTIAVGYGGTGTTSFTTNGVLYGQGTSALAVTAAGTSGQLLVANTSGVPSFVTMSGDATFAASGALTISANAVDLGTHTTGNYVATIADAGNSTITVTGSGTESAAVTLDVVDVNCTDCLGQTEISDIYVLNTGDTMTGTLTVAGTTPPDLILDNTTTGTPGGGNLASDSGRIYLRGNFFDDATDTNTELDMSIILDVTSTTDYKLGFYNDGATTEVATLDESGNLQLDGDLTISGDDLFMTTNTSGYILVADGTNFNPVAMSGDVAIDSTGLTTIQANAVDLGTHTTGNYVATIADAGNSTITVTGSGTESAAVTLDVVDVNCTDCLGATEISDIYVLNSGDTITGLLTINPGTTPTDAFLLDIAQPTTAGTRDSHNLLLRGTSFDTAGHNADWRAFVDVTSNAGASTLTFQSRIDTGAFGNRLLLTDAGNLTVSGGVTTSAASTFNSDVDFVFGGGENLVMTMGENGLQEGETKFHFDLDDGALGGGSEEHILQLDVYGAPGFNDANDSILDILAKETLGSTVTYNAGIRIQASAVTGGTATLTDGILINTAGAGGTETITDAIDASDPNITNALRVGDNNIVFENFHIRNYAGNSNVVEFINPAGSASLIIASDGTSGYTQVNFSQTATANGVCHSGADIDSATDTLRTLVACTGAPGDIAEWYETDGNAEEGEIVVTTNQPFSYLSDQIDPLTGELLPEQALYTHSILTESSEPYQNSIIGVVSTSPVQTFGRAVLETASFPKPITVAGRVPIKVSLESGPIQPGDPLTSSSIPGVAMKATRSGPIVGKSLESFDGADGEIGKILAFVQVSYYISPDDIAKLQEDARSSELTEVGPLSAGFGGLLADFTNSVRDALASFGIFIENGILQVQTLIANVIETENLKVGSPEKPTGITIFDEDTGQPYCIKMKSGQLQSAPGECGAGSARGAPQPLNDLVPVSSGSPPPPPAESEESEGAPAEEELVQDSTQDTSPSAAPETLESQEPEPQRTPSLPEEPLFEESSPAEAPFSQEQPLTSGGEEEPQPEVEEEQGEESLQEELLPEESPQTEEESVPEEFPQEEIPVSEEEQIEETQTLEDQIVQQAPEQLEEGADLSEENLIAPEEQNQSAQNQEPGEQLPEVPQTEEPSRELPLPDPEQLPQLPESFQEELSSFEESTAALD